MFSNIESELRAFESDHAGNVSYAPFCDFRTYRIAREKDWDGMKKMAAICPVNLVSISAPVYSACVIGGEVFWNEAALGVHADTDGRLRQLAALAGLDLLKARFTFGEDDLRILAVEPFPDLEGFSEEAIRKIAEALVKLLQSRAKVVPRLPTRRGQ